MTSTDIDRLLNQVALAADKMRAMRRILDQRARDRVNEQMVEYQDALDAAIRAAYEKEPNQAQIARATGTTDRNSIRLSLRRTAALNVEQEEKRIEDSVTKFRWLDGDPTEETPQLRIEVTDLGQTVTFLVDSWEDDAGIYLTAEGAILWNDDYSERNELVFALDGKNINPPSTFLEQEVLSFITNFKKEENE